MVVSLSTCAPTWTTSPMSPAFTSKLSGSESGKLPSLNRSTAARTRRPQSNLGRASSLIRLSPPMFRPDRVPCFSCRPGCPWRGTRRRRCKIVAERCLCSRQSPRRPCCRECRRCPFPRKCRHCERSCGREPFRRSEEHTSELQSLTNLVCRLLLEKKTTSPITVNLLQSLTYVVFHGSSAPSR